MNAYLDALNYCISSNFPAPITAALLTLLDDPDSLPYAAEAWAEHDTADDPTFAEATAQVTGDDVGTCYDCDAYTWWTELVEVQNGRWERHVCQSCLDDNYYECDRCQEWAPETSSVGESDYCQRCYDNYAAWCETCEVAYDPEWDDDHDHDDNCECEAPHRAFTFPANSHGTICQDERLAIDLPAGTISDEGIRAIVKVLRQACLDDVTATWYPWITPALGQTGPEWQTKMGNFTKRLSRNLYSLCKGKMPAPVLAEIGNLARQHSAECETYYVEVTRNLNQPADCFYHEDSCWWRSYSESRCALKSWGGIGLRTYESADAPSWRPSGRAWIQPLDATLKPTHDTDTGVYVVYNGYGDLQGYAAARILAYLASASYTKCGLTADPQYVNGGQGYLVASEATCAAAVDDGIAYEYDRHETR